MFISESAHPTPGEGKLQFAVPDIRATTKIQVEEVPKKCLEMVIAVG
jgi:hypothetical protein